VGVAENRRRIANPVAVEVKDPIHPLHSNFKTSRQYLDVLVDL